VTKNVLRIQSCEKPFAYAVRVELADVIVDCFTGVSPQYGSLGQRLDQLLRYPGLNAYAPWQWIVGHAAGTSTMDGRECGEDWFQPQEDILGPLRRQLNGRDSV
jgi:hypothetical protein